MRYLISGVCFLFLLVAQPVAAKPSLMPVPRTAPEWIISEWINGKGKPLKELRGKVVIVDFFQLWCPGCNQFSIPLLNHWEKVFDKEIKDGKLEIISIHTVFEGHDYQNPKKLKSFLRRKKIHHLVGIDRHAPGQHTPQTMRLFGTMGTPEIAFIDKKGIIRFQEFGWFDPDEAARLLRRLMDEKAAAK
jgi:thiol-disulfide isomerase/thioredoxin